VPFPNAPRRIVAATTEGQGAMSARNPVNDTGRAGVSLMLAGILAGGALVAVAPRAVAAQLTYPAPVQARNAKTVNSDFLPTAQLDSGVVWALKVIGNTVYAGGSFSAARPAGSLAGQNTVPRSNLLAFNLTTGALTSFAPTVNGQVKSLTASPDGSRLYVGGSFTTVNGQSRYNIAAFDTATGALNTTFKPAVGGSYVNAIAATSTAVYLGGLVSAGNGVARKNLMAFNTSGVLLGWAPTTDLQVDALVMNTSGSKVIVGGRFATVNGVSQRGLAALSPADGSIQPWIAPTVVKNGWNDGGTFSGKAGIYSLSTDGTAIYGTGWVYANATVGNLEGTFSADPESGAIKWLEDCHGDTYTTYSDGTNVYATGHQHDCESVGGQPQKDPAPGNMHNSVAFTASTEGTLWRSPRTGSTYKDWSGQPAPAVVHWFPDWLTGTATGQGQAGWVMAGSGDYLVVGGEFPGLNNQTQQGIVRFARPNVSGADDGPRLSGSAWTPSVRSLAAGTARITIGGNWDRDDINLTYRITRSGQATPVYTKSLTSYFWYQPSLTFSDTGLVPGSTYTYRVSATDADGNQALSSQVSVVASGSATPAYVNKVLTDGAVTYLRLGDGDGGVSDLLGANAGVKGTGVTQATAGATAGGRGYHFNGTAAGRAWGSVQQQSPDGWSAGLWFRTTSSTGGKLLGFGTSQSASSGTSDRHLYMLNDGRLNFGVFQNNTARVITSPASYRDGNWHQAVVTSDASGAALYIDGARVAFDAGIIKGQNYWGYYHLGGDNLTNWPSRPANDNFTGDLDEFAIYSYGLTAAQVSSQYAVGTGAIPPHQAPTAAFTGSASGLTASVDASASTATDGATLTYAWNWGDGTASGSGMMATHTYATAGTRSIVLTLIDSLGGTSTLTRSVIVSSPVSVEVATATFGSDVASGWGSANPGGAFTTTAGTDFSVSGGEAKLSLAAKATRTANLVGASARDMEGRLDLGLDKLPSPAGTQVHANYELRRGSDGSDYRLKVRFSDTGAVILNLCKFVGTTETSLAMTTVPGLTYVPGARLRVAFEVTGTGTTSLRAKAWSVGASEPTAWLTTATDSEATLQDAGYVGFVGYANSITNGPITASVDNLRVTTPA